MSHGTIHWTELNTRDAEGAKAFYSKTMGWTYDSMPMDGGGTYWLAKNKDEMVAGIFDISSGEMGDIPNCWMTYVAVDDIDKRAKMAKDNGATILQEPFDVPGVGRIAMIMQPDGAAVGWMTPSND
ncbi:MAG: VOC family protein [Pseudomonadota bacterium]